MTIKNYPAGFLLLFLLCAAACKKVEKDIEKYYPETSTSAAVQPDGTVLVTGRVLSTGGSDISNAGFCLDTVPHPSMLTNQTVVKLLRDGSTFTATYANLDALKQYYVRSFATNALGYAYGEEVMIGNAGIDTNSIPCHPAANSVMTEGDGPERTETFYYVEEVGETFENEFTARSNTMKLAFDFGKKPVSGVYYTVLSSPGANNQVSITFTSSSLGSFQVAEGANVYVTQVSPGIIKVVICHAQIYPDFYLTTSVITGG